MVEGPVTLHLRVRDHTYMILEVSWTAFGHFLLGSHNFHGLGSWLVCEVGLIRGKKKQTHKEIIQIKQTLSI
jgi:hypothetical protein